MEDEDTNLKIQDINRCIIKNASSTPEIQKSDVLLIQQELRFEVEDSKFSFQNQDPDKQ